MQSLNRREFLINSGAAAALAATPGMVYSQVMGSAAPFDDYRALVCVFLHGGNDSFNMLVPRSDAEYAVYANARQNLAIPQNQLLPVNPLTSDGAQYGLHPSMVGIQTLFESRQAAFVANVGPLVEPTTRDQYRNGSVTVPTQLFSHNDQQAQWHSLKGASTSKTGWAGRMADLIRTNVVDQQMATNASLSGTSLFQSGDETVAYVMGQNGPLQFEGFSTDPGSPLFDQRLAFGRIVDAQYGSIYERGFAEVQRRAIDSADAVSAAISRVRNSGEITTVFPMGGLGNQLQTAARLIASRDQLGMQRQIFFVGTGGFDTHDDQINAQPALLQNVSDAIAAFHAATAELGIANSVTTFTQSDFGRTLTSNGDGTDHAWGGNQVVVGGAVSGRNIYGTYPLLQIGGPDDTDNGGRMIPSTSADQFAATLAKWFGIPDVDLNIVAPNLDNFVQRDLGFLV